MVSRDQYTGWIHLEDFGKASLHPSTPNTPSLDILTSRQNGHGKCGILMKMLYRWQLSSQPVSARRRCLSTSWER